VSSPSRIPSVSAGATAAAPERDPTLRRERLVWLASVAFCGILPAVVIAMVFASTISDTTYAIDFVQFYRGGEAVLAGRNLYPPQDALLIASAHPYPYVYPPLAALVSSPFTVFSLEVVGVVLMAVLVAVVFWILRLLGVQDWRCYGIVLLWPPVISAIQTANPTLWFALAAALAWRYRDRRVPLAAAVGTTLAVKFVLWPLLVWLTATRRAASAVLATTIGVALLVVPWAVIGFEGFTEYPGLLRRLEQTVGDDAYTMFNLASDLGAPNALARAIWLVVGLGVLAACVFVARGGDERSAFILALAASLALSPLVWLHYFALLMVAVAVAQPRLGLIWFFPLAMFVATGHGDPGPARNALTLATAAFTIALALREVRGNQRLRETRAVASAATSTS
jgi:alpha-1,2-mannosyltransferase